MALPIDARLPEAQLERARAALRRAKAVGEEYEGVEVATATVRARRAGQAIVEEARRRGVEVIVLAAEEPSRIRGGALLGGRGGPLDNFVGDVTKYVVSKAPCRVILTAPPAPDGRAGRAGAERCAAEPCARFSAPMFVLIVGAGRVGSHGRQGRARRGPRGLRPRRGPALARAPRRGATTTWEDPGGRFTVGHAIEIDALLEAGIEQRRRLHRLDRRRQHQPRHRPDRPAALRGRRG